MTEQQIRAAVTPRELEAIVAAGEWRQWTRKVGITAKQLRRLCKRWGVQEPELGKPGRPRVDKLPLDETRDFLDRGVRYFGGRQGFQLATGTSWKRIELGWLREGMSVNVAARLRTEWPGVFE